MKDLRLRNANISIDYRSGMSRVQVANKYDLDPERVRQIHAKTIVKALQHAGEQEWQRHLQCNFTDEDFMYLINYREYLLVEIEQEKKHGVYKYE